MNTPVAASCAAARRIDWSIGSEKAPQPWLANALYDSQLRAARSRFSFWRRTMPMRSEIPRAHAVLLCSAMWCSPADAAKVLLA